MAKHDNTMGHDLIAIITSFSARLGGLPSHETQQLLASTRAVLKDP